MVALKEYRARIVRTGLNQPGLKRLLQQSGKRAPQKIQGSILLLHIDLASPGVLLCSDPVIGRSKCQ
jgi:hypothetical protein